MATKLNVSENQEKIPLTVSTKSGLRTITPDDGSPYYVGARAYVTQNVDGATVTVIDKDGTTTANIYNGQTGATGADGADGFSPTATVTKSGNTATITITDKNGTTTAEVYDGSAGGASAFVAEFNVTTYADVKDAYDNDAILICTVDDNGNTMVLQFVYFDDANEVFFFAIPISDGVYWTELSNANGWDDGTHYFASTDVATQLADGLMSALDKQKLDGIASGAEVNVQSDWSQSDNTKDDFIKNKPTIPTKVSDLSNDSGFTSTSVTQVVSTGTKIATVTIDGTGTDLYAPSGGGGSVTDVEVDGTSVVTGGVAEIDLTGKSDVGHTHTTSAITDFPTTVSSFTNDAGYITGYTETDPIFSASAASGITSSDITTWNNKSDFSGDYDDLTDKPTIPSNVSDLVNDSGFITSPNVVYCTCGTATSTVAKEATIVSGSLTTLTTGAQAIVKFTYANSATNPTLKVGSTDAKSIKRYGSSAPSTSSSGSWNAGSCVLFVYDGTDWQIAGWLNSTYSEISEANITASTGSTAGLVTGRRAKAAVEAFAPVQSVNGSTGAVTLTIPTDTSDLTNGAGFITGYTETDPVFSASAASGITSSDISDWNSKSEVSVTRHTTSGTNIADLTIDGTTTKLYAPTGGGGGSVTDVWQNGSSVLDGTVGKVNATLVQIVRW